MKTYTKILMVIIVIIVVVLTLHLYAHRQSRDSFKIGAILSLTGNGAAYGLPAQRAMMLATEKINKEGGVGGKNLEIVYEDSQFDPKIALSAYQSLSARGIHLMVTNGSSVSIAVRKPVVDNHEFQFESAAVTPLFTDGMPNTCRFTLTAPVSGKKLGEFVAQKLTAKTVATLTLNDDYGKAMSDAVSDTVSAANVVITGRESFDKNATDFRTQITKLIASKPDVLLVVPAAGQANALFKQLRELGWKGTIVSDSWTIVNDNLKDVELVDGVYFVNYDWNSEIGAGDSHDVVAFKTEYRARFGSNPPVVAANVYDEVMLMAKAISAIGTDNPEAVGVWLSRNVNAYNGVTGPITLNNDCEAERSAVIQQVKGGSYKLAD